MSTTFFEYCGSWVLRKLSTIHTFIYPNLSGLIIYSYIRRQQGLWISWFWFIIHRGCATNTIIRGIKKYSFNSFFLFLFGPYCQVMCSLSDMRYPNHTRKKGEKKRGHSAQRDKVFFLVYFFTTFRWSRIFCLILLKKIITFFNGGKIRGSDPTSRRPLPLLQWLPSAKDVTHTRKKNLLFLFNSITCFVQCS